MKEVGIDISSQKPKDLTEDMMRNAAKIINMGCMDKDFCPTLFVPKVVDWGIEDPKDKPIEKVREIRDEIEEENKRSSRADVPRRIEVVAVVLRELFGERARRARDAALELAMRFGHRHVGGAQRTKLVGARPAAARNLADAGDRLSAQRGGERRRPMRRRRSARGRDRVCRSIARVRATRNARDTRRRSAET